MLSAVRQDQDQASCGLACLDRLRCLRIQLEKHVELEWTSVGRKLKAMESLPNPGQYRSARMSIELSTARTAPEPKNKRNRGGLFPSLGNEPPRRSQYIQKIEKVCM